MPLDTRLMNRLLKAIRSKRRVSFHYASVNSHPATVDPYKIVHYDGFWYLVAREDGTGIIKRYALDKLKDLKMLPTTYAQCRKISTNCFDRAPTSGFARSGTWKW